MAFVGAEPVTIDFPVEGELLRIPNGEGAVVKVYLMWPRSEGGVYVIVRQVEGQPEATRSIIYDTRDDRIVFGGDETEEEQVEWLGRYRDEGCNFRMRWGQGQWVHVSELVDMTEYRILHNKFENWDVETTLRKVYANENKIGVIVKEKISYTRGEVINITDVIEYDTVTHRVSGKMLMAAQVVIGWSDLETECLLVAR